MNTHVVAPDAEDIATTRSGWLVLLGLAAGFCSGFLGIGGGLIIVPALALGFSLPIKRAVGVSLASVVVVSLVAVVVEFLVKRTNLYWGMALAMTAGSLIGSALGARVLPRVSDRALRTLLAVCLLMASYRMLTCASGAAGSGLMTFGAGSPTTYLLAVPIGVMAGLTSTLFGIGGGVVTIPCLSLLFRDVPFHAARATSLATIVPTSTFGAYQHYQLGTVDLGIVRRIVPSAVAGATAGVILVNFLAPGPCRAVFAVFVAAVAVRLLMGSTASRRSADVRAPGLQRAA